MSEARRFVRKLIFRTALLASAIYSIWPLLMLVQYVRIYDFSRTAGVVTTHPGVVFGQLILQCVLIFVAVMVSGRIIAWRMLSPQTMLFPRRCWAVRVVAKAGFRVPSREARTLIGMLIFASRQQPSKLPVAEQVLISAMRMFLNQSAVVKLAEELAASPAAAEEGLKRLPEAALAVASEYGLTAFVETVNRLELHQI